MKIHKKSVLFGIYRKQVRCKMRNRMSLDKPLQANQKFLLLEICIKVSFIAQRNMVLLFLKKFWLISSKMCEITRENFEENFPQIAQDIEEATFLGKRFLWPSKMNEKHIIVTRSWSLKNFSNLSCSKKNENTPALMHLARTLDTVLLPESLFPILDW